MTVFSISFLLHFPPIFLPPCFCHIFVPFLPKKESLSTSDVSSLSHPSHSFCQFRPEVTKAVHQAVYLPSVECTTYTSGEVQYMRSFSGLTAAFGSHYIWSKYLSAPVEKIKTKQNTPLPLKSRKLPKLEDKTTTFSEKGWVNDFYCVCCSSSLFLERPLMGCG